MSQALVTTYVVRSTLVLTYQISCQDFILKKTFFYCEGRGGWEDGVDSAVAATSNCRKWRIWIKTKLTHWLIAFDMDFFDFWVLSSSTMYLINMKTTRCVSVVQCTCMQWQHSFGLSGQKLPMCECSGNSHATFFRCSLHSDVTSNTCVV